ncbi:MAG: hypothetical protein KF712_14390 [Akkermansiaceae bacterium]|nr:hypothetical protein [Akkermansiaceae bacterium]
MMVFDFSALSMQEFCVLWGSRWMMPIWLCGKPSAALGNMFHGKSRICWVFVWFFKIFQNRENQRVLAIKPEDSQHFPGETHVGENFVRKSEFSLSL